jgi:hypothetical protein
MPFIDGQYVEMHPEMLAEAIHRGQKIGPHYYDYEDAATRENRIKQEWDTINKILKSKYPDTWRKYNDPSWSPDADVPGNIPLGSFGANVASNTGGNHNALMQLQPKPSPQINAMSVPSSTFNPVMGRAATSPQFREWDTTGKGGRG